MQSNLSNKAKIDLIFNDALNSHANCDDNCNLSYALNNGFKLHAASIWLGTGAMSEEVEMKIKGVKISHKAEMKEIKDLINSATIFICEDCNHHHFLSKSDAENLEDFFKIYSSCGSCNSKKIKIDLKQEKKTVKYERKTTDEYILQGDYGHGFEDLTSEDTRLEIKQRLKESRDNDGGTYRIIKKRVKIVK